MKKSSKLVVFSILLITLWTLAQSQGQTEYKVVKKQTGTSFIKLQLEYTGKDDYYIKQKSVIIKDLIFQLKCLTFQDFNFKIYDANNQRYQVPQGGIFPKDPFNGFSYPLSLASFTFSYTERPFGFEIKRKADNTILFSTQSSKIIFSEYYIEIGTETTSQYLYGLSERFTNSFRVKEGKWTIFPRDRGQMMDYGIGKQTHGYYPIYLQKQGKINKYHMSYFRSSNALDVIVEDLQKKSEKYQVTYKVIGGIIDFRFFIGEFSPEELILRFQQYLGRSAIPPFWSLGFHQCRWGYQNVTSLKNVIAGYQKNDIPLDTIWSDIDYMKQFQTFTIDEDKFPLQEMSNILAQYHYIPIIQPSIRYKKGFAWEQGTKRNIFIQDAEGNDQIGKVWAGQVLFTDYFHPNATDYWVDMLQHLYDKVKFSGAWIDMNQISNLCNGPCSTPSLTGMDFTNDIPYHPGNDTIQTQAIPLNATHYGNLLEANVHTFFGFMETYATNKFLSKYGRPFIITRSNTLGSNKYGFHWTGDNYANFSFLKTSISSNFMFNFWGIQMVGSDICGFGGNATEENCARWFQLGSLYPFARNHNQIQANDQQPYALGNRVLKSSQLNIKLRYSILKEYYRLFISKKGYGFIFKPLFFEFFSDQNTFNDQIADTQFMIGSGLMSAPIVQENKNQRSVYFPASGPQNQIISNWYCLHTGKYYEAGSTSIITNQIDDLVPIFIRDGYSILQQDVTNVHKSSDLKSDFMIVGGFKLDQNNPKNSVKQYYSEASVLAINDYEDQASIQKCIEQGCEYKMIMTLSQNISTHQKQLKIEVLYTGDRSTMGQINITGIKIYSKEGLISQEIKNLAIDGNGSHIIPINDELLIQ